MCIMINERNDQGTQWNDASWRHWLVCVIASVARNKMGVVKFANTIDKSDWNLCATVSCYGVLRRATGNFGDLFARPSPAATMTEQQQRNNEEEPEVKADGWPNLFAETCEMALCSIFVFALADLRRLARNKQLQDSTQEEEILRLPMAVTRMHELWVQNQEALRRARLKSSDFATLLEPYFFGEMPRYDREATSVRIVGDENASNECVYVIGTNSARKRIILAFRGSITIKDWIQDAKTIMGSIPNPVKSLDSNQPDAVGVHLGFRDYLYGESPSLLSSLPLPLPGSLPSREEKEQHEEDTNPTKVEVILNQLRALREECPDYKIYVSGHSLGGALALIVALEAAAVFGGGVTCITIGNPKTGNYQFRSAINLLERTQKLRCLGIHNFNDIVPMLPSNVCRLEKNKFCHVGFEMVLQKHRFEIVYKGSEPNRCRGCRCLLLCCTRECRLAALSITKVNKNRINLHNYREYLERLMEQKGELKKLSLNDFYSEELDLQP